MADMNGRLPNKIDPLDEEINKQAMELSKQQCTTTSGWNTMVADIPMSQRVGVFGGMAVGGVGGAIVGAVAGGGVGGVGGAVVGSAVGGAIGDGAGESFGLVGGAIHGIFHKTTATDPYCVASTLPDNKVKVMRSMLKPTP